MTTLPFIYKDLASQRLLLRRLKEKDAAVIFSLRSDPQINRYTGRKLQQKQEEAAAFIEMINKNIDDEKAYYWGIIEKVSEELVGTICLWNLSDDRKKAEIGYELLPAYHGKGIMKEAIGLLLVFIFDELQMDIIEAWTHKDNIPSAKLLSYFEFTLTDQVDPDNNDVVLYTLFKH